MLGRAGNAAIFTALEKQFTEEEEEFILAQAEESGWNWTQIARLLKGHSAKTIQNRCLMMTRIKQNEKFRQPVQRERQKSAFLEAARWR
jgi:hypothetical protein